MFHISGLDQVSEKGALAKRRLQQKDLQCCDRKRDPWHVMHIDYHHIECIDIRIQYVLFLCLDVRPIITTRTRNSKQQ